MAADRLVVTLRMLETEVKQTPGIKQSIEIIQSHTRQLWTPQLQIQDRTPSEGQNAMLSERMTQIGMSLEPVLDPLPHQSALPPQIPLDLGLPDSSVDSTVADTPRLHLSERMRAFVDQNLQLNSDWVGWDMDDSGGGFVPDMAYWGSFDQPL